MNWFILICYIIAAYGACNVIVFGSGPFRIFEHIRSISNSISEHFGLLFSCMMCLPTNFGIICSLLDWFLFTSIAFTPFNIIFAGTNLWWMAMLLDGAITSGAVWAIHNIVSFFENIGESNNNEPPIIVDDITANSNKKEILND